ncbi:transcriptional regulator [Halalkalibacter wakoensis JCM 9140]|uniref:Transcriptional regulator n=1 Tax=Halalkalibacter wakoensis JCM 9140 TaxID=1236970 RepID=W4Q2W1_9BACI|nr:TetR/AcrR family transcriptional regulator [Halalkalibacter wakoensis]GAE26290.1 transcriptional regulator [Halalkalibacter wakoensis JCM 9140]
MRKRSNKPEQILVGAADVFLDVGFEKATIQEIAIRSGVGKGTIYEYFSSKEELFSHSIKSSISFVLEKVLHVFECADTFDQLLGEIKVTVQELLTSHEKKIEWLYYNFQFVSKDLHQWIHTEGYELIHKASAVIERLMSRDEVRRVHSFVAASMIVDIIQMSFFFRFTNQPDKMDEIIDSKIDILKYGLSVS